MSETRRVWIVWQNTDLTEGRGSNEPIAICETEATARRIGKGKNVQGSDCTVSAFDSPRIDGAWVAPYKFVYATREDEALERRIVARREAVAKARELGLSEDEILALRGASP
jgi:hypothetical protein